MATRFVVTQIKPCLRCKGSKFVTAPIWADYWTWFGEYRLAHEGKAPSKEEDRDWWAELGYYDWEPAESSGGIPNEEMECPDCGGFGELRVEVDLFDALKAYEEMGKCAADIGEFPCTCGWH